MSYEGIKMCNIKTNVKNSSLFQGTIYCFLKPAQFLINPNPNLNSNSSLYLPTMDGKS
jgi:hypothetical protein